MMRAVLSSEKREEPAQKKREEKTRSVKQEHTADRVPLFLRCLSKIGHPCCRKEVNNVFLDRSNIVTIQGPNGQGRRRRVAPRTLIKGYGKNTFVSSDGLFVVVAFAASHLSGISLI